METEQNNPYQVDGIQYLPGLYDLEDSTLVKEHYLLYILKISTSDKKYTRHYLSKKEKAEYEKNLKIRGSAKQKYFPLDDFPKHQNFIKEYIKILGEDYPSVKSYKAILGLYIFCSFLESEYSEEITLPSQIDNETQFSFYTWIEIIGIKDSEFRNTYEFFYMIANKWNRFNAKAITPNTLGAKAYSEEVIYRLDIAAQKFIEESMQVYAIFEKANERAKNLGNLFTLENLLKTRYSKRENNTTRFLKKIDMILKKEFNIKTKLWNGRYKEKYKYASDNLRKEHQKLLKISESGIDIFPSTLELKMYWFLKIYPNWPESQKIDIKYRDIFYDRPVDVAKVLRITNYATDFLRFYRPALNEIYPLFLLLLIRTGKNQQVILDWMVQSEAGGIYELGIKLPDGGRKISSIKSKTNTQSNTYLHVDNQINLYIDFFLKLLNSRDAFNNDQYFFKGWKKNIKGYGQLSNRNFTDLTSQFLSKLSQPIVDNNIPLKIITHTRIRPSFNAAQYWRGLNEFQKQMELNHKNPEMQHKSYDNSIDIKTHKLMIIAKAQCTIQDLFKGRIIEIDGKRLQMGKGPLSDCANPKEPTHNHKQKIKTDEVCTDWTMCFFCDKSEVYKPLHGPVIASLKVLLDETRELINTLVWEKEYSEISDAVESVWLYKFTEKERFSYLKEASKHTELIESLFYMKRKRKINKEKNHALSN